MPDPLIILGSGGNGLDVLDVVDAINAQAVRWRVAGFLDDSVAPGTLIAGVPVLGGLRDARSHAHCRFVNSIGAEKSFRKRPEILALTGLGEDAWETLVHPGAHVSPRARMGRGVYVCAGAVIASNVTIGDQATIHPGCVVGHDAVVGPYAILAPGSTLSGFVKVGARG
jgi:bifunctional N-acetylglucosamine-1-phosphate-uridyltransferase/glucosamine-1-phosphate-acetyltransferase GlmU-like protein